MSKKQKILSFALCIVSVISICVMVVALNSSSNRIEYGEFVPPEFDDTAVAGEPDVPNNLGYSLMNISENYDIYLCGKLFLKDGSIDVYFTSDNDNSVWVKLEILDENNTVIGETGVIKPGEYVKSVTINRSLSDNTKVKLKVIGYEPNTYLSAGSANMKTTIEFEQ